MEEKSFQKRKTRDSEGEELRPFSVSEINQNIRQILERKYPLVWIRGEVSNFKAHHSGHFYFYIKDDKSALRCVMFRSSNRNLRFQLKEGLEVLICGKVTVYEPRGDYQILCDIIKPKGIGELQLAFEQLKEKLKKEGLFDEEIKKPLPFLPSHVAVVTSPTGAAFQDILNILSRRFKGLRITLIPALVQGEEAPSSLIEGIRKASYMKDVDVLILTRGGGSQEDLWCFNHEDVARAIAHFPLPVISAVGHEIDFTISDFVADLRAPTPSAAAELVVKDAETLIGKLKEQKERLVQSLRYKFNLFFETLKNVSQKLNLFHPRYRLEEAMISCDDYTQRLQKSLLHSFKEWYFLVKKFDDSLTHLSPFHILKRGYVVVKKDGVLIDKGSQLKKGNKVKISFSDKDLNAEIL